MPVIAQGCTPFGVLTQGVDAAIDIDGRVALHGAAVGDGNFVIRVAVGLQHGGQVGQQLGTLGMAQRAQGLATGFAGKGKGGGQIQARGIDTDQWRAQHGIQQCAAGPGRFASGQQHDWQVALS